MRSSRLASLPKDAPAPLGRLIEQVRTLTDGIGVDVAMEVAGSNSSLNNAIKMTRRGEDVVLFGVKNSDAIVEDSHRVVMDGIQMHGVVGRRIFRTWGIHWLICSRRSPMASGRMGCHPQPRRRTMVDIEDWAADTFEEAIRTHPKVVISFAG